MRVTHRIGDLDGPCAVEIAPRLLQIENSGIAYIPSIYAHNGEVFEVDSTDTIDVSDEAIVYAEAWWERKREVRNRHRALHIANGHDIEEIDRYFPAL